MLCMRDNRSSGLRLLLWSLPGAQSSFPPPPRHGLGAQPHGQPHCGRGPARADRHAPAAAGDGGAAVQQRQGEGGGRGREGTSQPACLVPHGAPSAICASRGGGLLAVRTPRTPRRPRAARLPPPLPFLAWHCRAERSLPTCPASSTSASPPRATTSRTRTSTTWASRPWPGPRTAK
jgi:hypothetical protein